MKEEDREYLATRFKIPKDDILWHNSGICYDRIQVKTLYSAQEISKAVQGETVNGGMFHGMPLGGISEHKLDDGTFVYEIIC